MSSYISETTPARGAGPDSQNALSYRQQQQHNTRTKDQYISRRRRCGYLYSRNQRHGHYPIGARIRDKFIHAMERDRRRDDLHLLQAALHLFRLRSSLRQF